MHERATIEKAVTGHLWRNVALILMAAVLACGMFCLAPRTALADEVSDQLAATAQRVSEASQAYDEAQAALDDVNQRIADNQARIDEIEAKLPEQREQAADSMVALYKISRSGTSLVDLMLSSEDFNSLVSTMRYLNVITSHNNDEVQKLLDMEDELESARDALAAEKDEAETAKKNAQQALDEANAARAAAEAAAQAQAQAEAAEAAEVIAEAQAAAEQGQTFTTESGETAQVTAPAEQPTPAPAPEATSDVDQWTARIDAFLAGSPMAGHGRTFAEAALRYGVDPRFSPAIAAVESGKGAVCFRPYNAWGWGNSSWGSWDEAINAHVAGLASGYGYTVSLWAAKRYCPPNWSRWYAAVSAQMAAI